MYRIGIDLGGTNIAIGIVDKNANIIAKNSIKTNAHRGPEAITRDMAELSKNIIKEAGISDNQVIGVGIGCPGTIDTQKGVVITSNNIVMSDFPMVDYFKKFYDKPTYINNDANCAALGELKAGAAKGRKTAVLITLGTGIGGGIIIDGKIFSGRAGGGAELGHTVIVSGGEQCTCGRKGCWEAYASATALHRQAAEIIKEHPDSELKNAIDAEGKKISGKKVFEYAKAGDKAAQILVQNYLKYVAEGITDIANVFQPDIILIGGGIAEQGEIIINTVKDFVAKNIFTKHYVELPEIKRAELGNDAGIIGAAMLVEEEK